MQWLKISDNGIAREGLYLFSGVTALSMVVLRYKNEDLYISCYSNFHKEHREFLIEDYDHYIHVPWDPFTIEQIRKLYPQRNITGKKRYNIFKRDSFRCMYCGRSPNNDNKCSLVIDHIIPYSKGGTNEEGNLQSLCRECNSHKGNSY